MKKIIMSLLYCTVARKLHPNIDNVLYLNEKRDKICYYILIVYYILIPDKAGARCGNEIIIIIIAIAAAFVW